MIDLIPILAAEGAKSPVDFKIVPYFTTVIVAGASFFILVKFVWPRIIGGLDDREAKILGEIKGAEDARAEAEAAKAEFERSLAEARKEATEMVAQARNDAATAAAQLKAQNERELGEMKQRARAEIQSAQAEAVSALHAEATALATAMASKILQREVSVEDQQRLLEDSLRELGAARSN